MFHPHKVQLYQEINDPDRRLQFCEELIQQRLILIFILLCECFSDESDLNTEQSIAGIADIGQEKLYWIQEAHIQNPQIPKLWVGVLENSVLGSFFIDENVNGEIYLNALHSNTVTILK